MLYLPSFSSISMIPWQRVRSEFTALHTPSIFTVLSHQDAHLDLHRRLGSRSRETGLGRRTSHDCTSPTSRVYFCRPRHCLWRCPRPLAHQAVQRRTQACLRRWTWPHNQHCQFFRCSPLHILRLKCWSTNTSRQSWIWGSRLVDEGTLPIQLGWPHHHWQKLRPSGLQDRSKPFSTKLCPRHVSSKFTSLLLDPGLAPGSCFGSVNFLDRFQGSLWPPCPTFEAFGSKTDSKIQI